MIKKTIKYTDYNGVEHVEDFYFNLTRSEIVEMEMSVPGGMIQALGNMSVEKDQPQMLKIIKDFILKSYGEKSSDGKRFIKSAEMQEAFSQTEAYSELFMEMMGDMNKALAFLEGATGISLADQVQTETKTENPSNVTLLDGIATNK